VFTSLGFISILRYHDIDRGFVRYHGAQRSNDIVHECRSQQWSFDAATTLTTTHKKHELQFRVTSHNGRGFVLCVLCPLCMHPHVHAVA